MDREIMPFKAELGGVLLVAPVNGTYELAIMLALLLAHHLVELCHDLALVHLVFLALVFVVISGALLFSFETFSLRLILTTIYLDAYNPIAVVRILLLGQLIRPPFLLVCVDSWDLWAYVGNLLRHEHLWLDFVLPRRQIKNA
jgi:hypothetical protein